MAVGIAARAAAADKDTEAGPTRPAGVPATPRPAAAPVMRVGDVCLYWAEQFGVLTPAPCVLLGESKLKAGRWDIFVMRLHGSGNLSSVPVSAEPSAGSLTPRG